MIHACNAHWWMTRNRIHVFDKNRDSRIGSSLYLRTRGEVLLIPSSHWPVQHRVVVSAIFVHRNRLSHQ
jgi:hypothetical protein